MNACSTTRPSGERSDDRITSDLDVKSDLPTPTPILTPTPTPQVSLVVEAGVNVNPPDSRNSKTSRISVESPPRAAKRRHKPKKIPSSMDSSCIQGAPKLFEEDLFALVLAKAISELVLKHVYVPGEILNDTNSGLFNDDPAAEGLPGNVPAASPGSHSATPQRKEEKEVPISEKEEVPYVNWWLQCPDEALAHWLNVESATSDLRCNSARLCSNGIEYLSLCSTDYHTAATSEESSPVSTAWELTNKRFLDYLRVTLRARPLMVLPPAFIDTEGYGGQWCRSRSERRGALPIPIEKWELASAFFRVMLHDPFDADAVVYTEMTPQCVAALLLVRDAWQDICSEMRKNGISIPSSPGSRDDDTASKGTSFSPGSRKTQWWIRHMIRTILRDGVKRFFPVLTGDSVATCKRSVDDDDGHSQGPTSSASATDQNSTVDGFRYVQDAWDVFWMSCVCDVLQQHPTHAETRGPDRKELDEKLPGWSAFIADSPMLYVSPGSIDKTWMYNKWSAVVRLQRERNLVSLPKDSASCLFSSLVLLPPVFSLDTEWIEVLVEITCDTLRSYERGKRSASNTPIGAPKPGSSRNFSVEKDRQSTNNNSSHAPQNDIAAPFYFHQLWNERAVELSKTVLSAISLADGLCMSAEWVAVTDDLSNMYAAAEQDSALSSRIAVPPFWRRRMTGCASVDDCTTDDGSHLQTTPTCGTVHTESVSSESSRYATESSRHATELTIIHTAASASPFAVTRELPCAMCWPCTQSMVLPFVARLIDTLSSVLPFTPEEGLVDETVQIVRERQCRRKRSDISDVVVALSCALDFKHAFRSCSWHIATVLSHVSPASLSTLSPVLQLELAVLAWNTFVPLSCSLTLLAQLPQVREETGPVHQRMNWKKESSNVHFHPIPTTSDGRRNITGVVDDERLLLDQCAMDMWWRMAWDDSCGWVQTAIYLIIKAALLGSTSRQVFLCLSYSVVEEILKHVMMFEDFYSSCAASPSNMIAGRTCTMAFNALDHIIGHGLILAVDQRVQGEPTATRTVPPVSTNTSAPVNPVPSEQTGSLTSNSEAPSTSSGNHAATERNTPPKRRNTSVYSSTTEPTQVPLTRNSSTVSDTPLVKKVSFAKSLTRKVSSKINKLLRPGSSSKEPSLSMRDSGSKGGSDRDRMGQLHHPPSSSMSFTQQDTSAKSSERHSNLGGLQFKEDRSLVALEFVRPVIGPAGTTSGSVDGSQARLSSFTGNSGLPSVILQPEPKGKQRRPLLRSMSNALSRMKVPRHALHVASSSTTFYNEEDWVKSTMSSLRTLLLSHRTFTLSTVADRTAGTHGERFEDKRSVEGISMSLSILTLLARMLVKYMCIESTRKTAMHTLLDMLDLPSDIALAKGKDASSKQSAKRQSGSSSLDAPNEGGQSAKGDPENRMRRDSSDLDVDSTDLPTVEKLDKPLQWTFAEMQVRERVLGVISSANLISMITMVWLERLLGVLEEPGSNHGEWMTEREHRREVEYSIFPSYDLSLLDETSINRRASLTTTCSPFVGLLAKESPVIQRNIWSPEWLFASPAHGWIRDAKSQLIKKQERVMTTWILRHMMCFPMTLHEGVCDKEGASAAQDAEAIGKGSTANLDHVSMLGLSNKNGTRDPAVLPRASTVPYKILRNPSGQGAARPGDMCTAPIAYSSYTTNELHVASPYRLALFALVVHSAKSSILISRFYIERAMQAMRAQAAKAETSAAGNADRAVDGQSGSPNQQGSNGGEEVRFDMLRVEMALSCSILADMIMQGHTTTSVLLTVPDLRELSFDVNFSLTARSIANMSMKTYIPSQDPEKSPISPASVHWRNVHTTTSFILLLHNSIAYLTDARAEANAPALRKPSRPSILSLPDLSEEVRQFRELHGDGLRGTVRFGEGALRCILEMMGNMIHEMRSFLSLHARGSLLSTAELPGPLHAHVKSFATTLVEGAVFRRPISLLPSQCVDKIVRVDVSGISATKVGGSLDYPSEIPQQSKTAKPDVANEHTRYIVQLMEIAPTVMKSRLIDSIEGLAVLILGNPRPAYRQYALALLEAVEALLVLREKIIRIFLLEESSPTSTYAGSATVPGQRDVSSSTAASATTQGSTVNGGIATTPLIIGRTSNRRAEMTQKAAVLRREQVLRFDAEMESCKCVAHLLRIRSHDLLAKVQEYLNSGVMLTDGTLRELYTQATRTASADSFSLSGSYSRSRQSIAFVWSTNGTPPSALVSFSKIPDLWNALYTPDGKNTIRCPAYTVLSAILIALIQSSVEEIDRKRIPTRLANTLRVSNEIALLSMLTSPATIAALHNSDSEEFKEEHLRSPQNRHRILRQWVPVHPDLPVTSIIYNERTMLAQARSRVARPPLGTKTPIAQLSLLNSAAGTKALQGTGWEQAPRAAEGGGNTQAADGQVEEVRNSVMFMAVEEVMQVEGERRAALLLPEVCNSAYYSDTWCSIVVASYILTFLEVQCSHVIDTPSARYAAKMRGHAKGRNKTLWAREQFTQHSQGRENFASPDAMMNLYHSSVNAGVMESNQVYLNDFRQFTTASILTFAMDAVVVMNRAIRFCKDDVSTVSENKLVSLLRFIYSGAMASPSLEVQGWQQNKRSAIAEQGTTSVLAGGSLYTPQSTQGGRLLSSSTSLVTSMTTQKSTVVSSPKNLTRAKIQDELTLCLGFVLNDSLNANTASPISPKQNHHPPAEINRLCTQLPCRPLTYNETLWLLPLFILHARRLLVHSEKPVADLWPEMQVTRNLLLSQIEDVLRFLLAPSARSSLLEGRPMSIQRPTRLTTVPGTGGSIFETGTGSRGSFGANNSSGGGGGPRSGVGAQSFPRGSLESIAAPAVTARLYGLTKFPLRSVAAILVRHDTTELLHILFNRRAIFQEALLCCNKWMTKAFYYLTKQLNHLFTGELQVFASATAMRRHDLANVVDRSSEGSSSLAVSIAVDAYTIEDVHRNLESLARVSLRALETVMDHQRQLKDSTPSRPQGEGSRSIFESLYVKDTDSTGAGEGGGRGTDWCRTPPGSVGPRQSGQRGTQSEKVFRTEQPSQLSVTEMSVKGRMLRMFSNSYWATLSFRVSHRIEQAFHEGKCDLTLSSTPAAPTRPSIPVVQYPVLSPITALHLFPDIAAFLSKVVKDDAEYATAAARSLRRAPNRTVQHALFLKVSIRAWIAARVKMRKVLFAAADEEIILQHGLLDNAQKHVKQTNLRSASCLSGRKVERSSPQTIDEMRTVPRETNSHRYHNTPETAAGTAGTVSSASSARGSLFNTSKTMRVNQRDENLGFATFPKDNGDRTVPDTIKDVDQLSTVALHALLTIEMQHASVDDMIHGRGRDGENLNSAKNSPVPKVSDILMQEVECEEFLCCMEKELQLMLPSNFEPMESPKVQKPESAYDRMCSLAVDKWIETLRERERGASESAINLDFRRLAPPFFLKHVFSNATSLLLALLGMQEASQAQGQPPKATPLSATLPLHVPAKTTALRAKPPLKEGAPGSADSTKIAQHQDRAMWQDGLVAGISRRQLITFWREESTQSPRWHFILALIRLWGRLAQEMDVTWNLVETLLAVTAGCEAVGGWLTYSAALAQQPKVNSHATLNSARDGHLSRQSMPLNVIQQVWCSLLCEHRSPRPVLAQYRKAALAHCLVTHQGSHSGAIDVLALSGASGTGGTSSDTQLLTPRTCESHRLLDVYLSVVSSVDLASTAPALEAPLMTGDVTRGATRVLSRSVYYHIFLYTMIYMYSFRKKCSFNEDPNDSGSTGSGHVPSGGPGSPSTTTPHADGRRSGLSATLNRPGSSSGIDKQTKAVAALMADLESGALYYMDRDRAKRPGKKKTSTLLHGQPVANDDFLVQAPSTDRSKGNRGASVPKSVFEKYRWRFSSPQSGLSQTKPGTPLTANLSMGSVRVNRMVVKRIVYGNPESAEFIPWVWMTECIWDSVDGLGTASMKTANDSNTASSAPPHASEGADLTASLQQTIDAMAQAVQSEADLLGSAVRQLMICGTGASVTAAWLDRAVALIHYSTWSLRQIRKVSDAGLWGFVHNDLMYIDAVEGPIVHAGMCGEDGANFSGLRCTVGVHDCGVSATCGWMRTPSARIEAAPKPSPCTIMIPTSLTDVATVNPSDSGSSLHLTVKKAHRRSTVQELDGDQHEGDDADSNENSDGGTWMVHTNADASSVGNHNESDDGTWSSDSVITDIGTSKRSSILVPPIRMGMLNQEIKFENTIRKGKSKHRCWHEEEYYAVRTQTALLILTHLACSVPQATTQESSMSGSCNPQVERQSIALPLLKQYVDVVQPIVTHLDFPVKLEDTYAVDSPSRTRGTESGMQLSLQRDMLSAAQATVALWCEQLIERASSHFRSHGKPSRAAREDSRELHTPRRGMSLIHNTVAGQLSCTAANKHLGLQSVIEGAPFERTDTRWYVNDVHDLFDMSLRTPRQLRRRESELQHEYLSVEDVSIRSVVERVFEAVKVCNASIADLIIDEMVSWSAQHSAMTSSLGPKTYTDVMLINPLNEEMTSERICCCTYISALSLQQAHVILERMSFSLQGRNLRKSDSGENAHHNSCMGTQSTHRTALQRRLLLMHGIVQRQLGTCPHHVIRVNGQRPFWIVGSMCVLCKAHSTLNMSLLKTLLRNFTSLECRRGRNALGYGSSARTSGSSGGGEALQRMSSANMQSYPAFTFPSEFSVDDVCEFGWTAVALMAQADTDTQISSSTSDSPKRNPLASPSTGNNLALWPMACSLMTCELREYNRVQSGRHHLHPRCPSILRTKICTAIESGALIVEEAQRIGVERFIALSAITAIAQPFDGDMLIASNRSISAAHLWSADDRSLQQTPRLKFSHGDPNDCTGAPYFAIAQISDLLQELVGADAMSAPFLAFSEAVALVRSGHIRSHGEVSSFVTHISDFMDSTGIELNDDGIESTSDLFSTLQSVPRYLQAFLTTLLTPTDEFETSKSSEGSKRSSRSVAPQINLPGALKELIQICTQLLLVDDGGMFEDGETLISSSVSDGFLKALDPHLIKSHSSVRVGQEFNRPSKPESVSPDGKDSRTAQISDGTQSRTSQSGEVQTGISANVSWLRWCVSTIQDFRPYWRHTIDARALKSVSIDESGVAVDADPVLVFQRAFLTYVVRPMIALLLATQGNDTQQNDSSTHLSQNGVPLLFFEALLREAQVSGSRFYLELLQCYSTVLEGALSQCSSEKRVSLDGSEKESGQVDGAVLRLRQHFGAIQSNASLCGDAQESAKLQKNTDASGGRTSVETPGVGVARKEKRRSGVLEDVANASILDMPPITLRKASGQFEVVALDWLRTREAIRMTCTEASEKPARTSGGQNMRENGNNGARLANGMDGNHETSECHHSRSDSLDSMGSLFSLSASVDAPAEIRPFQFGAYVYIVKDVAQPRPHDTQAIGSGAASSTPVGKSAVKVQPPLWNVQRPNQEARITLDPSWYDASSFKQ